MRKPLTIAIILVMLAGIAGVQIRAASPPTGHAIEASQAVLVADLWLTNELSQIPAVEEAAKPLAQPGEYSVWALVGPNELVPAAEQTGHALAYVVVYRPLGFVVIAGDDRIEPVLVFSVDSEFRWDQPERNFLRHYLATEAPNRWLALEQANVEAVHPHWLDLQAQLSGASAAPDAVQAVNVLLGTALWGQGQFYDTVVIANNGDTAGIPTGCTATATAIKMRFHQWPARGVGSHSYSDVWGAVRYNHSVNFADQTYDWAAMPIESLSAANAGVANLMYHAGVAVDMDYEVGRSGAWPTPGSMNSFFGYRGTVELTSGHNDPIRDSILGRLPVVLSTTAHTVLADGYRDTVAPYFHLNLGWDGASNGWYSLDAITPIDSDPTIDRSYPYSAPTDYVYVDGAWTGSEVGTLPMPYNTINEGAEEVPTGGKLWIKAGSYTGTNNLPITVSTAMTISSYTGLVTIGTP